MSHDPVSGVMMWVGGLMVLTPMLFAGALLVALWHRNRTRDHQKQGGERMPR